MTIERITILNRQNWLNLRLWDVTASDVGAVCGESLFGSAAEVWAIKKGLLPPTKETARMRAGRWFEPSVFEALAEERPHWEIRRAKVYLRDVSARLGATPDAIGIDPERDGIGVIEAKNILPQVFIKDWCDGDDDPNAPINPPMAYQLQVLTQAMLAEATWAAIVVLINNPYDPQLHIVPVERHAGAEKMIRERVEFFHREYLDPGICPPIDPARDHDLVKKLYPRDDGREVDLTGDNRILELVDELAATKASVKRFDQERVEIETEIKQKLGTAAYGCLPDGRLISWKTVKSDGYYVKPREYRTLRVTRR